MPSLSGNVMNNAREASTEASTISALSITTANATLYFLTPLIVTKAPREKPGVLRYNDFSRWR